MLPTIELGIIVFTSLEERAPSVSGEEAITKWTPGALSPGKSACGTIERYGLNWWITGNPEVEIPQLRL